MFWSFFALFGKSSAFVGPFITSAVIADARGNANAGYGSSLVPRRLGTSASRPTLTLPPPSLSL